MHLECSPPYMRFVRAYLPVVLWMLVIFLGSTDLGSARNTSRFIGPLLRWLKPDISDDAIRVVQACVRKAAHVTTYAVLTALTWSARQRLRGGRPEWKWSDARVVLAVSVLYAISDELHQAFVSTRQASGLDVLIDTAGACLALFAIWTAGRWKKYW
jgi:VanZ family protein